MDQQPSRCVGSIYSPLVPPRDQNRSFASSARGTKMKFRASASRCRPISLSRNAQSNPILSLVKTLNSSWFPGESLYIKFAYQLRCDVVAEWREACTHMR